MKVAYFDCFSGISGDMCLGALVDAGISLQELEKELKKIIPIRYFRLTSKKVKRSHIVAKKVDVIQNTQTIHQHLKRWKDIEKIIKSSTLSRNVKQKGLSIFKRLFEAEARVHGESFNNAHLHELGAVDSLVDIFGTIIGLKILGVEKVCSSPVNLGCGIVNTEHGFLPVPAPATAEILKNVPVYSKNVSCELTTPTGAAIIKELAADFGAMPVMNIKKIGIGAGSKNMKNWPNVLRVFIGNPHSPPFSKGRMVGSLDEKVTVIETNIDDMNPQIFEYAIEKLYAKGALDVYLTQVIMKKGRPGVKMTILCINDKKEQLMGILLKETSTIGLRFYETRRRVLQREIKTVDTEFGKVRIKLSSLGNNIIKAIPEYEDCKRIAKRGNLPLIEILNKIK